MKPTPVTRAAPATPPAPQAASTPAPAAAGAPDTRPPWSAPEVECCRTGAEVTAYAARTDR